MKLIKECKALLENKSEEYINKNNLHHIVNWLNDLTSVELYNKACIACSIDFGEIVFDYEFILAYLNHHKEDIENDKYIYESYDIVYNVNELKEVHDKCYDEEIVELIKRLADDDYNLDDANSLVDCLSSYLIEDKEWINYPHHKEQVFLYYKLDEKMNIDDFTIENIISIVNQILS